MEDNIVSLEFIIIEREGASEGKRGGGTEGGREGEGKPNHN